MELLLLGVLAFYLVARRSSALQAAPPSLSHLPPAPVPSAGPQPPTFYSPGGGGQPAGAQQAASAVASALANEVAPGTGGFVGAVASTIVGAGLDIAHGNVSPVNVAEVAFLPVAVTATAVNALSNLFGFSGRPLDAVDDVLVAAIKDPAWSAHSNLPPQADIFGMDDEGTLHYLPAASPGAKDDAVHLAGYSWREVIALPPEVVAQLQVGDPATKAQIRPMPRPTSAAELRLTFGSEARCVTGTQDMHGPWELARPDVTLIGVKEGAPEGPGAVYRVFRPWEPDYPAHPGPWAWKRHVASLGVLRSWGWSEGDIQWVTAARAAILPTWEPVDDFGPPPPGVATAAAAAAGPPPSPPAGTVYYEGQAYTSDGAGNLTPVPPWELVGMSEADYNAIAAAATVQVGGAG